MPSIYNADDPAAYEQMMGRWSRLLAIPFLDFAILGVTPASVLDLGCGTGSLAFAAAERLPGAAVTGLDHSEAYVSHARSRAADTHLHFEQGDAAALPYGNSSFDSVLSLLVLNFVPDAHRAAREMVRVTRPGGVVAAAVWDFRGGLSFLRTFLDTAAPLDQGAVALRARQFSGPFTGPGEFQKAWHAMGLRDVAAASLTIRTEFASFDDYWGPWLGGQGTIGAYVCGLPEEKREVVEHHTRLAYLAGGEDGPRSFTATAWAVRGVV
jgi:SAM-dependent methyltransferase